MVAYKHDLCLAIYNFFIIVIVALAGLIIPPFIGLWDCVVHLRVAELHAWQMDVARRREFLVG